MYYSSYVSYSARLYHLVCVLHSLCVTLYIPLPVCIPLLVYPNLYVSHSFISLYVFHSFISIYVYATPGVFRFVCIQLFVYSTLISHSVYVPLRGPLHAYPTSCVSHFVCPTPCISLLVCPSLSVPLLICSTLVRTCIFRSSYVQPFVCPTLCVLLCTPFMSHSACVPLLVNSFLSMYSTPCVSVYCPLFGPYLFVEFFFII